jgi:nicotinate dehydrogenase subunit A
MIEFVVNGQPVSVSADGSVPLLETLRNQFGLRGTRFGCGTEQCGACTVLVDNEPTHSCTSTLEAVRGKSVRTIEGLARGDALHPVQEAILAEQAGQCGYCLSGIVMSIVALVEKERRPDRQAILKALDHHLCRCGAQGRILRAVARVVAKETGNDGD